MKNVLLLHGFYGSSQSFFLPFLKERYDKDSSVHLIDLPNPKNPSYEEWKKCFLENIKERQFDKIIAHSLGGSFAINLIVEDVISTDKLVTLGSSFGPKSEKCLNNFLLPNLDLDKLKSLKKYIAIASTDDPWTHYEYSILAAKQTNAITVLYSDKGHFETTTLPEDILKLID